MTIFFTADTHFGHAAIIQHCQRGFADVAAMDAALIAAWNARVSPTDTVWHLGDFTLAGAAVAEAYLRQLNGTLHLVWGNHDRSGVRQLSRWATSQPLAEIRVAGEHITLCHYAMRSWNHARYGALMLYGHAHGTLPGDAQSLDVGVDAWGFQPVTLAEIQARLATQPPPA